MRLESRPVGFVELCFTELFPPTDAGDGLVELRKLEAAEEIAHNLSQSPNVVYLPQGGQNVLLNLPH